MDSQVPFTHTKCYQCPVTLIGCTVATKAECYILGKCFMEKVEGVEKDPILIHPGNSYSSNTISQICCINFTALW